MTSRSRFRLVVGLVVTGAITACVVDPLNPQPLPPSPDENGAVYHQDASVVVSADGGGTKGTADAGGLVETPPSTDAGAANDGASDASLADADAGDASDAH